MECKNKGQILVIATKNKGKSREIRQILSGQPVIVMDLADFPGVPDAPEDGDTFDENAYSKASFYARILGLPVLADDSGLCVEALGGKPGTRSARFADTDEERCQKILDALKGEKNRKAAFECVISIAVPSGAALTYEGRCEGIIAQAPSGENGFGYDPIFYYPPAQKTFAELSSEEKNRVSHRGRALAQVKEELDKILAWIKMQMPSGTCLSSA